MKLKDQFSQAFSVEDVSKITVSLRLILGYDTADGGLSNMEHQYDLICVGMALVDSIIKGFDPEPISASGFRAASGTLSVGGEAVNEAMCAGKGGSRPPFFVCFMGEEPLVRLVGEELLTGNRLF